MANSGERATDTQHGREWYRRLVETGSDVTFVLDETLTIGYVSPGAERVLGCDVTALIDETFPEYLHPADRNEFDGAIAELQAAPNESQTVELRFQGSDDSWRWLDARAQNRLDDDILGGIVVTVRDVTDCREREAELRTTRERMEMALEGANLGIWDWDMETDEVERDELLTEMLGYSKDEMGDHLRGWEQVVHPEGKRRHEEALTDHIENRTPHYQCEYRLETNSGDWKWVRTMGKVVERDDDGTPLRAVGIHQDIDDRKRAELALERERDVFRAGPAVVFEWGDSADWPIQYVSGNVEDVLGYEPEQLQSTAFADLVHEEDLEGLTAEVADQREADNDRLSPSPYRIHTADGDVRWVLEHTRTLEEGDDSRLLGYLVDITERKQREHQLKQFKVPC
jgi:PAS domain S-box-containing protein